MFYRVDVLREETIVDVWGWGSGKGGDDFNELDVELSLVHQL